MWHEVCVVLCLLIQLPVNQDSVVSLGGGGLSRPVLHCESGAAANNRFVVDGGSSQPSSLAQHTGVDPSSPSDGKWKARQVDRVARKIFPLSFFLFSLVYWLSYTILSSSDIDDEGEIPIEWFKRTAIDFKEHTLRCWTFHKSTACHLGPSNVAVAVDTLRVICNIFPTVTRGRPGNLESDWL